MATCCGDLLKKRADAPTTSVCIAHLASSSFCADIGFWSPCPKVVLPVEWRIAVDLRLTFLS
jgi:hypothetical protein